MSETERSSTPFNGWWYASAVLIVLVLLGAVAVVVLGGRDGRGSASEGGSRPTTAAPSESTGAASPPTSSGDTGPCSASTADDVVPEKAPDATWRILDTVAVPTSPEYGPGAEDGLVWRCYQHSPAGALFAAAVLAVTPHIAGGDQVLEQQVMPGPTRDALLERIRREPPPPKQPGETATLAGYRFLSYSTEQATLQIAYAFGGRFGTETYTLVWQAGDWKLDMDPVGGPVMGQPIESLRGFVQWGAV